ncbi:transposase [Luteimonas sp. MC1750]|uniref:REP-associated tyrosine transposase n=1 Tax=Luteimonas sp. MC1750 TaxID=2799326 RepID=UPI0018F0B891|nr:transposase [Luteimonas sp. MC1750]MBJ6984245.1 transposase [Luteimonas sp. MC1750]MBJ6985658.1 transposase [Luteimonas sp. MC1750]QQO06968.1 transposase [Luteimonas sp. MC1750]
MPTRRSPELRSGRWSEPGRIYLVTIVTDGRKPWFQDWEPAAAVARALAGRDAWPGSRLLCWVLMPDHWHGLLELGESESLSRTVGRAKAHATRVWKPDAGRLWQPGFHDRALRSDDNLLAAARYVVANPIRAGISRSFGGYSYWDAVWISADADAAS